MSGFRGILVYKLCYRCFKTPNFECFCVNMTLQNFPYLHPFPISGIILSGIWHLIYDLHGGSGSPLPSAILCKMRLRQMCWNFTESFPWVLFCLIRTSLSRSPVDFKQNFSVKSCNASELSQPFWILTLFGCNGCPGFPFYFLKLAVLVLFFLWLPQLHVIHNW